MTDSKCWLTSSVINTVMQRSSHSNESDWREILLHFLEVLDSLDRLINIAGAVASQDGIKEGRWLDHLQTLRIQMIEAFTSAGVSFFDTVGKPFNPGRHEAIEAVQRSDVDDYTIIEEITRGCEWQGEILRFAKVIVARNTT